MALKHLIYALQDPFTGEIRYVGRSSTGRMRAKKEHSAYCAAWLDRLRRRGKRPVVLVLQAFPPYPNINEVLNAAEVIWIAEMRARGCPLTNIADGGGGIRGFRHPEAYRRGLAQERAGAGNPFFGRKHSDSTLALLRQRQGGVNNGMFGRPGGMLGKKLTPEARAKISAAHIGRPKSEEHRAKLAAASTGKSASPEARRKMSQAHHGRKFTEEHKARIAAALRAHNVRRHRG